MKGVSERRLERNRMSDLQSPASDPSRAPIADTPARSDHAPIADTLARASASTNVMVALDSDEDPITLFGNMPIRSLLMHCLRQIGSARGTNDPSDAAYEMALRKFASSSWVSSSTWPHPATSSRGHGCCRGSRDRRPRPRQP